MVKDEIVFAILAKDKEYCLDYFLQCLYNQTYDKKKIHLYIRTNDNKDNTKQILLDYIKHNGMLYGSVFYNDMSVDPKLKLKENDGWNSFRFKILGKIRQESVDYAKNNGLHYFVADIDNFIRPNTLENMIKYKEKNVIAPMLKSTTCYSNFHYECESYDEVVKVFDMLDNLPLGNTRTEWSANAYAKLTNLENAKKLLADFNKPITCKFEYNIKKLMARA